MTVDVTQENEIPNLLFVSPDIIKDFLKLKWQ